MLRGTRFYILFAFSLSAVFAQQSENSNSGPTWSEQFQGSVSTFGWINRLDSSFGYQFKHVFVAAGAPVYFVRPSSTAVTAGTTTTQSVNGLGNVYARLGLSLPGSAVNFQSTLTATAPTGKKSEGLSTGHATFDWSNYLDHSFGRVTPFGEIGFANAISDTLFFVRPYTTYGFIAHVAGGVRYQIARGVAIGASAYDIAPTGQQTVVSRVVTNASSVASTTGSTATSTGGSTGNPAGASGKTTGPASGNAGSGMGSNMGASMSADAKTRQETIQTAGMTRGGSSIDRDYGYSTFARFSPTSNLSFSVGYTRSAEYALNTLFFGVETRLDNILRRK